MGRITDHHIAPRVIKQYLDSRMTFWLEPLGLQGSSAQYLIAVCFNPGASMKEISAYLMVDKSITTRTVGMLIDRGFVRNDSGDPRRYSLVLTGEGERAIVTIEDALDKVWGEILSDLSEEELSAFRSACVKINAKLSEGAGN